LGGAKWKGEGKGGVKGRAYKMTTISIMATVEFVPRRCLAALSPTFTMPITKRMSQIVVLTTWEVK